MKRLFFCSYCLLLFSLSGFTREDYSFVRIFTKASAVQGWSSLSGREKLMKIRKVASQQKTVSDPVSDRYTITAYGGPVDLVHFLMLAVEATRKDMDIKERLYKEWVAEGGEDHQFGFNPQYPCEAHPDDLPSNALGALFGSEIKDKLDNEGFDILEAFIAFIKPLRPLPDVLAKNFSHRRIVMGLKKNEEPKNENSRYIWFTAKPLNMTALINEIARKTLGKNFSHVFADGSSCLKQAGFRLKLYRGKTILIERL
jgi:hypothetical protein